MSLNIIYNFIFVISIYSIVPFVISDEDSDSQIQGLMGEMLQHTFACKQEFDDAGKNVDFMACLPLFMGKAKDPTKPEYEVCKCLGSCVSKKAGTMLPDGSAWNDTKVDEMVKIASASSEYKNMSEEFQTKVRPACKNKIGLGLQMSGAIRRNDRNIESPGKDCELLYNTVKCMMENSEQMQKLKEKFAGMLKMDE